MMQRQRRKSRPYLYDDSFISSEMNQSSLLTERIIAEISKSITVFKPSKSLYQLSVDDADENTASRSTDVDVVISGGGLKGYYVCGCIAVLQHQFNAHKINIARVSGASAGAWSAMFICCGLSTTLWIESYHRLTENPNKTIHEVYVEDLWPLAQKVIPENAYELCNNRLHVSITVITSWGLKNMIVNQFDSNEDLLNACLASSTIPYLTERSFCRKFRGLNVIDGGLTNNTPVFPDGIRRQLVFRLSQIEYPWRLLINPHDSCIDALVIRGALQMAKFLGGEFVPSIAWLEKKQSEQDLIRPGHTIRLIIAPIAVIGLIIFRTTGIGHLLEILETTFAAGFIASTSTVVDFKDAMSQFRGNPLVYALGTVFAGLASLGRSLYIVL